MMPRPLTWLRLHPALPALLLPLMLGACSNTTDVVEPSDQAAPAGAVHGNGGAGTPRVRSASPCRRQRAYLFALP